MKTWVAGAMVSMVGVAVLAACGSSGGSGSGGAASASSSTSSSHVSSSGIGAGTGGAGGAGGSPSTDPVCKNPTAPISTACNNCLNALPSNAPCLTDTVTECKGDPGCFAFLKCEVGCVQAQDGGMGAGGGSAGCIAHEDAGDAGSPENNCVACCEGANTAGANTLATDLANACICAPGAPCASACAM